MTDDTATGIEADNYFAIIPEWVLYAEISGNAVRLYGVFRRFADQTGKCFPSRKTLAEKCQLSEATVDRLIKELEGIGALSVQNRRTETGEYLSSIFFVRSVRGVASNTGGVYSQMSTGVLTGDDTGVLTSDDITRAIVNQSHEPEDMPTVSVGEKVAPSDFDAFWGVYPRKVGKTKALKVWVKLSKVDRAAALQALPEHVTMWRVKQVAAEFIPHPTSWLNGRRWEDELLPQQQVVPAFGASRSAPGMGLIKHIIQSNKQGEIGG